MRKGEEMQKVQSDAQKKVGVPDTKEDQIKVKRVALARKGSSDREQGEPEAVAHNKILSATQKVLAASPAFPVPVKVVPKLLERDLKKSAGKVSEAPAEPEKPAKDRSGKKTNTSNKENVCQQLLNMSLKAKKSQGKEHSGKKLGTYKGLVVRNRTINAESEAESDAEHDAEHEEDEVQVKVVVEKAFVVTRVTKKDNVAQSQRATKGVLTKTSRPWKRV